MIYGFTYRTFRNKPEKIIDIDATSEETATEIYDEFIKEHNLVRGLCLGPKKVVSE